MRTLVAFNISALVDIIHLLYAFKVMFQVSVHHKELLSDYLRKRQSKSAARFPLISPPDWARVYAGFAK
ncbi:MAG: hypothetical protein C0463_00695 [Idiomarina sp.]|nr:hypothetical protein [Idiomarina sp.]